MIHKECNGMRFFHWIFNRRLRLILSGFTNQTNNVILRLVVIFRQEKKDNEKYTSSLTYIE